MFLYVFPVICYILSLFVLPHILLFYTPTITYIMLYKVVNSIGFLLLMFYKVDIELLCITSCYTLPNKLFV